MTAAAGACPTCEHPPTEHDADGCPRCPCRRDPTTAPLVEAQLDASYRRQQLHRITRQRRHAP